MAIEIEKSPEEIAAKTPARFTRRTWRTQLEAPADQTSENWYVRGHREMAKYNSAGVFLGIDDTEPNPRPEVHRTLAQIATQEFTAAGATTTGAQLMALISTALDTFDTEDEAAAA